MKKLLLAILFASFAFFGSTAQTSPGNSAFGHSHKKIRHTHRHYVVTRHNTERHNYVTHDADRRAINVQHRTSVRTIRHDDNNRQQRDEVRHANVIHRDEIRTESHENGRGNRKDK